MRQVLGPGALGRPRGMGWRGRWEGGSGWGTHVNPWLIHVNVWQKPLQYCKVISLQLIKINGKKKKTTLSYHFIRSTKTNKNKPKEKKKQKFGHTQLLTLKGTGPLTLCPTVAKWSGGMEGHLPTSIRITDALNCDVASGNLSYGSSHTSHSGSRYKTIR